MEYEEVKLTRAVEVVQIPYGERTHLRSGTKVVVHQVLGGNFTVIDDRGMMVRIDAQDADALGEFGKRVQAETQKAASSSPMPELPKDMPADQQEVVKRVWELLRTCYDPEIPVNIVELGLIYELNIQRLPQEGFGVDIKMSLTAPGCGMGPVLQADVKGKITTIPGVKAASVEVVFEPAWDPSRMTEAARLQLGMM